MRDLVYKIMADIDLSPIKPSTDPEFQQAQGASVLIVQIVCFAAAVIILMILGIKFITAAPDGKAQIKERSIPAVTGAILLFAIGGIIGIVSKFASGNL
jgi:uncharacterized membrane protein